MIKGKTQGTLRRLLAGGLLLSSAAAISGCGTKSAPAQAAPVPVTVETIRQQTVPQTISVDGEMTPYVQTALSATTAGELATVLVRVGQTVKAGEVLATLAQNQNVPEENAVSQAQAAVQTAQTNVDNAQALYQDRTAGESQVVAAQNAVDQSKSAVQLAQVNLSKVQLQAQETVQGATQTDSVTLQSIVAADQQALQAAQNSLTVAQKNAALLDQQLKDAQANFGDITEAQVQSAYQNYQAALSRYDSWEQGSYAGVNPYSSQLSATQAIYQGYSSGYDTLQQTQQQYNAALQGTTQAQGQVASLQAALAAAQKNAADATPPTGSTASQLAQTLVNAGQASLNQAQTQYQAAQNSLTLANAIYNDRTQMQTQVDSAQAALNQAITNENSAQAALNLQIQNESIVSPFAGRVVAVNAQVGQAVSPQVPILTIASQNPSVATLNVPGAQVAAFSPGTTVHVNIIADNKAVLGKVLDVHPQPDPTTNEYQVDVQLKASSNVLPGMQVQGSVSLPSTTQGIYVPAQSVLTLASGGDEVFIVQNGVAHSQLVQIGTMTATQYQVTSGLKTGDVLVVAGQNYLSDGDKVHITSQQS